MSNSIWHNRDETPKDFCDVVLSDSITGSYCVFLSPFHDLSFNYDRWCYFDELLAQADMAKRLQKAVDIANEALKYARQRGLDNTATLFAVGTKADKALNEIRQLIKENQ